MLVPDSEMPGGERVKILDFGIAKGVSEYSGPAAEEYRTNTGMVLGTATYMAPEQCKGAGNVTDKADVYSLGVMMYRMCCGSLPFRAEGQGEVMAMHIFSTPRPLRDHDASIPEPMADLIARMMSKAPEDRPPMTKVAQELDKMLSTTTAPNLPVVVLVGAPPPEVSAVSSTLSAALGQSGSMKGVQEAPRRKPRLWLGALVTVALMGFGVGVRFVIAKMQPVPVVQTAVVVWALNSDPPNAQVVRKKDGKELCRTPCVQEPELGSGRLPVIFRAPGYADEEVVLDESRPFARPVKLRPEPASVPTPPPPTAAPPPPTAAPPPPAHTDAIEPAGPAVANAPPATAGAELPLPTRVNDPANRLPTNPKRGPTEPAVGKPSKWPVPVGPKVRGGKPADSILTDDTIKIIQ